MEDRDLAETPAEFAVLQQLSQPAFEGRIDGGRFAAEFVFAFPMRKENGIRRLVLKALLCDGHLHDGFNILL